MQAPQPSNRFQGKCLDLGSAQLLVRHALGLLAIQTHPVGK